VNHHIILRSALALATIALGLHLLPSSHAADTTPDSKEVKAAVARGIAFLKSTQAEDGSWSAKRTGPGVTGLVVVAMLHNGVSPDDPSVAKALTYLKKNIKKDGGIYDKGLANYTTSVAMLAFKDANKDGKYDDILKNGAAFLKTVQHPNDPKDPASGGAGYDAKSRPDMSNTQFLTEALIEAGVSKDDPALQNALKFVSRCQNLPGEGANDQPFAKKTTPDDKGGLTYVPLDVDDNPHRTPDGGLRSLGAMTYAGLKSFLYAGVSKDDPRVKGAIDWIRRHYTLEENPGLKLAGLYYYYHTFAKAMTALGEDPFEDAKGVKHSWRVELFNALKQRQKEDGSWINPGDRSFGESDPNIATAFALISLSYAKSAK
jgi:hypothetical protein